MGHVTNDRDTQGVILCLVGFGWPPAPLGQAMIIEPRIPKTHRTLLFGGLPHLIGIPITVGTIIAKDGILFRHERQQILQLGRIQHIDRLAHLSCLVGELFLVRKSLPGLLPFRNLPTIDHTRSLLRVHQRGEGTVHHSLRLLDHIRDG